MEAIEQIEFVGLPLAVYREIAAHLRQVIGVEVGLIPQASSEFDYNQSQVSSLRISWTSSADAESRERFKQIVGYYQSRYGLGQS